MLKMEDIAQYNGTEGINGPKKDSAIPDGVNQLPRTIWKDGDQWMDFVEIEEKIKQ